MNKNLFIILSFILVTNFCLAQRSTSKTITISYTIEPVMAEPADPVTYNAVIETPLDPLTRAEKADKEKKTDPKAKLNDIARTNLDITGSKYKQLAVGDWLIKLETGNMNVISATDKSWNDLEWTDAVLTYTCPATLTVQDKTGKEIFRKTIFTQDEQQSIPKSIAVMDPMLAAKMKLAGKNAEKVKKISDEVLESKEYAALGLIVEKANAALSDEFELQNKTSNLSVFSVKGKAYEELNNISDKIFDTYGKFAALNKKNRIPKEEMDKVFTEAIPVWEKYVSEHSEIEEEARKGLLLNCSLANTWVGNYDKAGSYLSQVPEAKSAAYMDKEKEGMTGPNVILSFKQSAENLADFYGMMKAAGARAKINQ